MRDKSVPAPSENNEHLIFRDGVKMGENVIKLDFTSPILTSGSAITRYVDKEDGAEYIYSLFVPSDASTAFPVFDQPDLKARFRLDVDSPGWTGRSISNTRMRHRNVSYLRSSRIMSRRTDFSRNQTHQHLRLRIRGGAVGASVSTICVGGHMNGRRGQLASGRNDELDLTRHSDRCITKPPTDGQAVYRLLADTDAISATSIYRPQIPSRRSSNPTPPRSFVSTREGIKYLETYFDYKFPFPKYDLVLIPEFPFGGMEHAGATFLAGVVRHFPERADKERLHLAGDADLSRDGASVVWRHGDDEMV